eukprot:CAMPEP_0170500610 /NCGR_PEP_ID=MMETSP0208-20121228/35436_1 /TAXON_ID=197538 /ORGANISM="Strombidium inclinatum, Strain S3" /LENGTH=67 /DNA_ID=CAMNT_0010778727 /DNA_START=1284 /DNA_END=1487 /DNA_ORIENTATION=+
MALSVIGFYIFKEFNHSMAKYLFKQEKGGQKMSRRERKKEIAKIKRDFRNRVSQEGLYYLYDDVDLV